MISRPFGVYPSYSRPMPFIPAPFGMFGGALLICGLIAVGSVVAPSLVESALPGWREKFGIVVILGVALGFIRSIWRLFLPILGVVFWIAAIACIWNPGLEGIGSRLLPSIASSMPPTPQALSGATQRPESRTESRSELPTKLTAQRPLPPALPDSAYFPAPASGAGIPRQASSFIRDLLR